MKKFLSVFLALFGCAKRDYVYEAYRDEARSRGISEKTLKELKPGQEVRYSCGYKYIIKTINGGVFQGMLIPPPPRCLTHNRPAIDCKYPEGYKLEQNLNSTPPY